MSDVDEGGALEAVERVVNRGGEPADVIEAVLRTLDERGVSYAAVRLAGGSELTIGSATPAVTSDIRLGGVSVGTLELAGTTDAFAARVATLISPYVGGASA